MSSSESSNYFFNKTIDSNCEYTPQTSSAVTFHKLEPYTPGTAEKGQSNLQAACRLSCLTFTPLFTVKQAICIADCNGSINPHTKKSFQEH